ncbi:MAG: lipoyl(octanoyl) transferase LipB [Nitrososphaerota archaeon]
MSADRLIEVLDLGLMEYEKVWRLQLGLVDKRIEGQLNDTIILVEHPHVYTLGRKGMDENILNKDVPCYRVERGGDATYHGPGQLVVYPILHLGERGLGVRELVTLLEESCIRTLGYYGVDAIHVDGKPGVWVGSRKIVSIGLAIRHWVTFHGLAFNVNTDLTYFRGIRPCGMSSEVMTSLEEILARRIPLDEVKRRLVDEMSSLLGSRVLWAFKVEGI